MAVLALAQLANEVPTHGIDESHGPGNFATPILESELQRSGIKNYEIIITENIETCGHFGHAPVTIMLTRVAYTWD